MANAQLIIRIEWIESIIDQIQYMRFHVMNKNKNYERLAASFFFIQTPNYGPFNRISFENDGKWDVLVIWMILLFVSVAVSYSFG